MDQSASGTGHNAALLAELVGSGDVTPVEITPPTHDGGDLPLLR